MSRLVQPDLERNILFQVLPEKWKMHQGQSEHGEMDNEKDYSEKPKEERLEKFQRGEK